MQRMTVEYPDILESVELLHKLMTYNSGAYRTERDNTMP